MSSAIDKTPSFCEKFVSKAPQKVIDGVKDNAEKLREKVRMIEESLKALQ